MIKLTMNGKIIHIKNKIIKIGDTLKFSASNKSLNIIKLEQFKNKFKIISSIPSIDTKICKLQTIYFNKEAIKLKKWIIITISKDLPFAQNNFCDKFKINKNFYILSDYRNNKDNFSNNTNLLIEEIQLLARAVIILDQNNKIIYLQIVKEITLEPNYNEIFDFIKNLKTNILKK